MGILGRIDRLVRGNLTELIDRMIDPAKEVELLITEMQDGMREAKKALVGASAEAKQCEQRASELREEIERWQRRAEQALQRDDEGLAREALRQRHILEQEQTRMHQLYSEQKGHMEQLKRSLKSLEARLGEANLRKGTLKQRARAAKKGHQTLAGGEAFERFDRLESEVAVLEQVSDLTASDGVRDAELEARFAQMERENPQVEDELAELKRRLEAESGQGKRTDTAGR